MILLLRNMAMDMKQEKLYYPGYEDRRNNLIDFIYKIIQILQIKKVIQKEVGNMTGKKILHIQDKRKVFST